MSLVVEKDDRVGSPEASPATRSDLILVVEDDAALLKLIERCLASGGYRTAGITGGVEALAWLERHTPRLMILDYQLPDMDGGQLLEQLENRGTRVPFVVSTGHGSERVAIEMMKRGACDYLIKGPAFMLLLPVVVDQALQQVRQAERLVEAETQLRQAHDELEHRVEQRTAELAEANRLLRVEMAQRREAEERATQHQTELAHVTRLSTVGEMVVELAHELNQPLSAIASYAQACQRLLKAEDDDPEAKELLSISLVQVTEQAARAAEIIRRLRRFVSKTKPAQTIVDLNVIVCNVAELIEIDARQAEVQVVRDLTNPLPPVVGDSIQLEQVLVNLMRNAFEALRESDRVPRRMTVRTAIDGGRTVLVEVHDNGGGIAPDAAEKVFDRFFTTKPNGMGMGLPISRSIIVGHGGRLWASSADGGGSIFHFTLPIDAGENRRGK